MAGRHVPDDFKRWQNELLFQTLKKKKKETEKLTFNLAMRRLHEHLVNLIILNAFLRRCGPEITSTSVNVIHPKESSLNSDRVCSLHK